jgi:geranylgeranyl pyrophosphate synthase
LIGLEQAKLRARELIDSSLEELRVFDMRGQPLAALARYVIERKK